MYLMVKDYYDMICNHQSTVNILLTSVAVLGTFKLSVEPALLDLVIHYIKVA